MQNGNRKLENSIIRQEGDFIYINADRPTHSFCHSHHIFIEARS
jgi:uncharacterized RmlC-like cupin family protein